MIKVMKLKKLKYEKEIFFLRNSSHTRKLSINQNKIKFEDHLKWLKKYIKVHDIFIILKNNKFTGYIRIEKCYKRYVSWAILKKYHGKINFYKILKKITKSNQRAKIKKNNIASIIVALKANFKIISLKSNYLEFKKLK